MPRTLLSFPALLLVAFLLAPPVLAAKASPPITVELTAEASQTAANDLARATVFAEATDSSPRELAGRVNGLIGRALETAKGWPAVKVQSAGSRTWPQYDKAGRIIAWHMRTDLQLESRDIAALSELMGRLQSGMGVSQIGFTPSPETRRKAEDAAIVDAIAALESRAKLVANSLHSHYRIRQMTVGTAGGNRPPFLPMARAAMSADAMPLEAGESHITVTITGQIELAE